MNVGTKPKIPTTTNTIPTDAERKGDFSALLPLGCPNGYLGTDSSHCANSSANPYQLYNPYTATLVGTTVTRKPIPNNILTNAGPLSPVALSYLKYYPSQTPQTPIPTAKIITSATRLQSTPSTASFTGATGT